MAFSDVIARLAVSLSLDTAAFQTGSRKAQREVTGLQGHMTKAAKAISGALAGMVTWQAVQQLRDWTQAAVDSAGGLAEQAAQLGVTTDALQEYRYAATQVGLSSAEMDQGFQQLTRRMGDAAQAGKGPVVEAFRQIGLTLDEIKGKTAGDVMPLIAEGLSKVEDPAQRAAIAFDLFGRAGQKLLPLLEAGRPALDDLREAAHELGIVLTEGDIAKADEVADKVAALRYVLEAQQNKKLLENADALLEYEQAVADLKLTLIEFSTGAEGWFDTIEGASIEFGKNWSSSYEAWAQGAKARARAFWGGLADDAVSGMRRMVEGIQTWVTGRLNAVWKGVTDKIDTVKAAFRGMYMSVVGGSYVPDMVDGIAAEMARLDAVMVAPVKGATTKAQQAFRDMAEEVHGLLDRLFPEIARANAFLREGELIRGSNLSDDAQAAAMARSSNAFATGSPLGTGLGKPAWIDDVLGDIEHGIDPNGSFMKHLETMTDKVRENTVRIAKSFKDMAEDTLGALNRMTSAIKGGGFLDILEAVIGLGLQLGGIGVFGKTIAGRINATVPRYAGGTNFHPGGLALVGERGPELVSMPRGSRVTANDNLGGLSRVEIVDTTGLFRFRVNGQIMEAAPAIADAGGQVGMARMQYRASRRWR